MIDCNVDDCVASLLHLVKHNLLTCLTTQMCNQLIKYPFAFSVLYRAIQAKFDVNHITVGMMFIRVHHRPELAPFFKLILTQNVYLNVDDWVYGYLWYLSVSRHATPLPVNYTSEMGCHIRNLRDVVSDTLLSFGLYGPHETVCRLLSLPLHR